MSTRLKENYKMTVYACFIGYIVQAIVNNFVPLLFLTFQSQYNIPLSQITLLVTINFVVQLLVDLVCIKFVDHIGYRISLIIAHIFAAMGLISLGFLPEIMPNPFTGILIAVIMYAIGGGLLEVLVSPVVEACPTDNKEAAMSLLHSFYCWGHVGVVLLSTLFFALFGIENWKIVACVWAVIPIFNIFMFSKVPIVSLIAEGEESISLRKLFSMKLFWVFMLMMVCSGASEQAVSQWASTFAEQGLGISKTLGDLAGPMSFAIFMGLSRLWYGKYGENINLDRFMVGSGLLCIIAYLCISLVPNPIIGIIGCWICGLSVGIMWPGSFSKAAAGIKNGGTAMFALLALAGDLGCSGGPTLAGLVAGHFDDNLRMGILFALVFPIFLIVGIWLAKCLHKSD